MFRSFGFFQWLFLVPKKGGRWHSPSPVFGRKNTTYIPLIVLAEPGGPHMLHIPTELRGNDLRCFFLWFVVKQWSGWGPVCFLVVMVVVDLLHRLFFLLRCFFWGTKNGRIQLTPPFFVSHEFDTPIHSLICPRFLHEFSRS